MNVRAKERKPNYRQIIIISLAVLAGIYHFSRPTLEKWTGRSLPSIVNEGNQQANNSNNNGDRNYETNLPDSKSNKNSNRDNGDSGSQANPGQAARNWLKDVGPQRI